MVAGIYRSSKRTSLPAVTAGGTAIELRASQRGAFEALRDVQFGILNAPTGWGKSLVLCALAGSDLLGNPNRKVVVCIPQKIIAKGFIGANRIMLPGRRLINWDVRHNLCAELTEKVDHLLAFLMKPTLPSLLERVIVTTHSNFARACQKLTADEFQEAFRNTSIVFDEAHHIQAGDDTGNQLGEVVKRIVDGEVESTRLLLATAFFFRGDKLSILEDRQLDRFFRHSIPFEDHWSSLQHLSCYRYDFVAYLGTVWQPLETLLATSQEATILYCPPEGHRLLLGKPKENFTRRILRLVKKHYGADLWVPGCKPTSKVILDLVDNQNRTEKIKFAIEHGDKIAAILTVGMFREGADWIQAKRIIDLIPTSSDQDRNQRFGRLIRDCQWALKTSHRKALQNQPL